MRLAYFLFSAKNNYRFKSLILKNAVYLTNSVGKASAE